jgi:hypothetical protein
MILSGLAESSRVASVPRQKYPRVREVSWANSPDDRAAFAHGWKKPQTG